jgi:hypothetical protein
MQTEEEENMKSRVTIIALASVFIPLSSLIAGVMPGRWDKLASLNSGTGIIVVLKSGERTESSFVSLGSDSLVIREITGTERILPKTEVLSIITAEKVPGKKLKGALIGAGVGFGAGFFGLAAVNAQKTASGPLWDGEGLGYYTGAGLGVAAVGAAVGAIVSSAHQHQKILYKAP